MSSQSQCLTSEYFISKAKLYIQHILSMKQSCSLHFQTIKAKARAEFKITSQLDNVNIGIGKTEVFSFVQDHFISQLIKEMQMFIGSVTIKIYKIRQKTVFKKFICILLKFFPSRFFNCSKTNLFFSPCLFMVLMN